MASWFVQVISGQRLIAYSHELNWHGDVSISDDPDAGGAITFSSPHLDACDSLTAASRRAFMLETVLNGILRASENSVDFSPLILGEITSGQEWHRRVYADSVEDSIFECAVVEQIRAAGRTLSAGSPSHLIRASQEDEDIRAIMFFLGLAKIGGNARDIMLSWPTIYKAAELARSKAAAMDVSERELISSAQWTRLKRTCNHADVIGFAARHAVCPEEPPTNQVCLSDAVGHVVNMAHCLLSKIYGFPRRDFTPVEGDLPGGAVGDLV